MFKSNRVPNSIHASSQRLRLNIETIKILSSKELQLVAAGFQCDTATSVTHRPPTEGACG